MKIKKFTKLLPCDLTQKEVFSFGQRGAHAVEELAKAELKKKEVNALFKLNIDFLKEQIADYSKCVTTEQQTRPVECEDRSYPARGIVETLRLDTGEIIDSRAMSREELDKIAQMSFDELSEDTSTDPDDLAEQIDDLAEQIIDEMNREMNA